MIFEVMKNGKRLPSLNKSDMCSYHIVVLLLKIKEFSHIILRALFCEPPFQLVSPATSHIPMNCLC